jgi:hypothetical protein
MGKQLSWIDANHREFIGRQRIVFAASAAPNARVMAAAPVVVFGWALAF